MESAAARLARTSPTVRLAADMKAAIELDPSPKFAAEAARLDEAMKAHLEKQKEEMMGACAETFKNLETFKNVCACARRRRRVAWTRTALCVSKHGTLILAPRLTPGCGHNKASADTGRCFGVPIHTDKTRAAMCRRIPFVLISDATARHAEGGVKGSGHGAERAAGTQREGGGE